MAVDLPPDPKPSSTQTRSAFVSAMAAMVDWFYVMIPQFNAAIQALNMNATNGTSSTFVSIGTGSKSFTASTGKSWVVGMTLKIAYSSGAWILGEVTSYDSGTGALVLDSRVSQGSGSYSSWTISLAPNDLNVGDHVVSVHTGNDYGSAKTKFRRFTTIDENVGSSITYADSASNGASFTINATGIYSLYYQDSGQDMHAITRNYSAGTSNPNVAVGPSDILAISNTTGSSIKSVSRVAKLIAGDVINAHTSGISTDTSNDVYFSIRRLS